MHGQHPDSLRVFETRGFRPKSNHLFLEVYVGRGRQKLETIVLWFAYKRDLPELSFLLRRNSECGPVTRIDGFYGECMRQNDINPWKHVCDMLNCTPMCANIEGEVICMYGGQSPELSISSKCFRLVALGFVAVWFAG